MITNCKNCIFAQHDGQQQNGCVFDVPKNLNKSFKHLYPNTLTIKDGFYNLENFKCPYGVTEAWRQEAISSGVPAEDIPSIVLKMTSMSYYLIYYLDDNIDILTNNLNRLSNMHCLPIFISFIKPIKMSIQSNELLKILNKYTFCKWKLHNIVDDKISYYDTIDMIVSTNLTEKIKILSLWNNKYMLTSDYFDRANQTLNYFLDKPVFISSYDNETNNGICFHVSAYINNEKRMINTLDFLNSNDIYKLYVI